MKFTDKTRLTKDSLRAKLKSGEWLPEVEEDSVGSQTMDVVLWLSELLESKDKTVRKNAAQTLVHLIKQSPPLSKIIFKDLKRRYIDKMEKLSGAASDWNGQSNLKAAFLHTIEIMREMKDDRITIELTRLLKCKNDEVAASAVNTLAALKDPQGTGPLIQTLLERTVQDRKWRYLRPAIIVGVVLLLAGFVWISGLSQIGGMTWGVGQGLVALWALNRWTHFLKNSVEALKVMQDPQAIGALALCARDRNLRRDAVNSLQPLMDQLSGEKFVALTPEQMEALTELLEYEDPEFQSALIRGLAVIGDEKAIHALEAFSSNNRIHASLRDQAQKVLPALRDQVARRAEARTLMRAPGANADAETLMRAPEVQPAIPAEQLLRADNGVY